MKTPHILLMAGGTGGHIFPALAIADWLSARGWQTTWLGSEGGMEESLVPQNNIPLETISIAGVRGKSVITKLLSPVRLISAIFQAIGIIRRIKPDVVLGMGGFASGPGGLASKLLGYPLCIHEQNAIAGMTNRYLAILARYKLAAFPNSLANATAVVGNPVRANISAITDPEARFANRRGPLNILVVGGSRGAAILNEILPATVQQLAAEMTLSVRHQAGSGRRGVVLERYSEALSKHDGALEEIVEVSDFINDMKAAYEWADLVVCRSGALTVSELASAGVASILIPFPHAVDDHQTVNGQYLVNGDAARMIQQPALTAEHLAREIINIGGREGCLQMAKHARQLAKNNATRDVANYCIKAAGYETQESVS